MGTSTRSSPVGPVTGTVDVPGAIVAAKAALLNLQGSKCYKQYKANGTLAGSKLGACEQNLLTVLKDLGG